VQVRDVTTMCCVTALRPVTRNFIFLDGAVTRGMEAPVAAERAFTCGTGKYYVTECCGTFIVQKQGWFGRSFVGYARDVAEAIARIESDAQCWTVRAA